MCERTNTFPFSKAHVAFTCFLLEYYNKYSMNEVQYKDGPLILLLIILYTYRSFNVHFDVKQIVGLIHFF